MGSIQPVRLQEAGPHSHSARRGGGNLQGDIAAAAADIHSSEFLS